MVWAGGGVRGERAWLKLHKALQAEGASSSHKASAGALTRDVSAHSTLSITAFCCWATN